MEINLYEHNQKAYDKMKNMIKEREKCCIIHPTGTGKSYIALKWLNENKNKKSLLVTSSLSIISQIEKTIRENNMTLGKDFPNLEIITYRKLMNDPNRNYDLIVLDEFHRAGAPKWGEGVKELLKNNKTANVLGLSATPVRYLDSKRDMSEELFEGNVASHITLPYAIAMGILPPPIYINAIYSFKEDLENLENKIAKIKDKEEKKELEKELKKARRLIEQAENLPEIFEKYLKKKDSKCLVFTRDIKHLKEMVKECPNWFYKINKDLDINYIHSEEDEEMNKYILDRFHYLKNDKLKLLFSIGMLNEGVHVEDIDAVIMLRPTSSPILYMQQLGRGLTTGKNKKPLIFDIVNNIKCLKDIELLRETVIKVMKKNNKTKEEIDQKVKAFKIIDDYKEITKLIEELDIKATYGWDEIFEIVKKFKEENDRFPTQKEPGGQWLSRQRHAYTKNTLSEDRIKKLDSLGDWNPDYNKILDEQWDENFEIVKKFKEEKSRFPTQKESGGQWLNTQKTAYKKGKLSEDRIKKLDGLGDWNPNQGKNQDDMWEENYEIVKRFKEENKRFPTQKEPGGNWLHTQRTAYKNGKLSKDRIKKLDSLGEWHSPNDTKWDENYEIVKKFKEEKSRFPTQKEPGGQWLHTQRQAYKNGKLSEDRIKKLDSLGNWNPNYDEILDEQWEENYEIVKKFKEENDRFPTPKKLGGQWLINQRRTYKKGKLSEDRIKKLDSLGNWKSARKKVVNVHNLKEKDNIKKPKQ